MVDLYAPVLGKGKAGSRSIQSVLKFSGPYSLDKRSKNRSLATKKAVVRCSNVLCNVVVVGVGGASCSDRCGCA